jgi:very-short-patch-repair endonuclease
MHPEEAVIARAARQHGVVTTEQLAAAGLGPRAIARRVAQGRLKRLHRGVYLAAPLPAPLTFEMAAVLACGSTATLSHDAAAALWGLRERRDGEVDVTTTHQRSRPRPGIRVHRARRLERTIQQRIPVTTPARTLLDLAPRLTAAQLDRAFEEAQVRRLLAPDTIPRNDGHPGAGRLAAAVARMREPALTRSEAEARLLALIREAELQSPRANARVLGFEVDLLWSAERLIVEVDGFAFHGSRHAFERDRRRDADLVAAGYRVIRFTWRQIVHEPEAVVARLAVLLHAIAPRPGE